MLSRTMTMLVALITLGTMGVAQAGPHARAAHHAARHAAHAAHHADRWVERHTPAAVVDWRLRHPDARLVVVDGYSVPSIAGVWSVSLSDACGHAETLSMSGSTPDEAVSRAKQAFKATGHRDCGQITITGLAWVSY